MIILAWFCFFFTLFFYLKFILGDDKYESFTIGDAIYDLVY